MIPCLCDRCAKCACSMCCRKSSAMSPDEGAPMARPSRWDSMSWLWEK